MVMAETSTGRPGAQARDAGDVGSLLGLGHRAAENYILDFLRIECRHAIKRATYGSGGKIVRASSGECALGSLAHSSADGGGDK